MQAGALCNREVFVIGEEETLFEAAQWMASRHVGCLVVTKRTESVQTPIGILTDRDIIVRAVARALDASTTRVRETMSTNLLTVREETDLYDVLKQMRSRGVRRVPVVNARGELEGILAYDDVVEWIAEELSDLTRLLARERAHERGTPAKSF